MKKISTAALVSLDYKISVPHITHYSMLLIQFFTSTEKAEIEGNVEHNLLSRNRKQEEITPETNSFTYLRLSKNIVFEKLLILAFNSPLITG